MAGTSPITSRSPSSRDSLASTMRMMESNLARARQVASELATDPSVLSPLHDTTPSENPSTNGNGMGDEWERNMRILEGGIRRAEELGSELKDPMSASPPPSSFLSPATGAPPPELVNRPSAVFRDNLWEGLEKQIAALEMGESSALADSGMIDILQDKLRISESARLTQEQELSSTRAELEETKTYCRELTKELVEMAKTLSEKDGLISELRTELQQATSDAGTPTSSQVQFESSRTAGLDEEVVRLREEKNALWKQYEKDKDMMSKAVDGLEHQLTRISVQSEEASINEELFRLNVADDLSQMEEGLRRLMAETTATCYELKVSHQETASALQLAKADLESSQRTNTELVDTLTALRREKEGISKELEAERRQRTSTNSSLEGEVETLQKRLKTLSEKEQSLVENEARRVTQLTRITSDLEKEKSNSHKLKDRVEELESAVVAFQDAAKRALADKDDSVATADKEFEELCDQIPYAGPDEKVRSLEVLEKIRLDRVRLTQKISDLEAASQSSELGCQELQRQLDAALADRDEAVAKADLDHVKNLSLMEEMKCLEGRLATAKSENQEISNDCSELRQKVSNISTEKTELVDKLKNERDFFQNVVKDFQYFLSQSRNDKDFFGRLLRHVETQLDQAHLDNQFLSSLVDDGRLMDHLQHSLESWEGAKRRFHSRSRSLSRGISPVVEIPLSPVVGRMSSASRSLSPSPSRQRASPGLPADRGTIVRVFNNRGSSSPKRKRVPLNELFSPTRGLGTVLDLTERKRGVVKL